MRDDALEDRPGGTGEATSIAPYSRTSVPSLGKIKTLRVRFFSLRFSRSGMFVELRGYLRDRLGRDLKAPISSSHIVCLSASLLACAMTAFAVKGIQAAPTTAVLGGGVCINEILPDPVGFLHTHNTDGNGIVVEEEFVELYNSSASAVDISGWPLWHRTMGLWFTFPGAVNSGTTPSTTTSRTTRRSG